MIYDSFQRSCFVRVLVQNLLNCLNIFFILHSIEGNLSSLSLVCKISTVFNPLELKRLTTPNNVLSSWRYRGFLVSSTAVKNIYYSIKVYSSNWADKLVLPTGQHKLSLIYSNFYWLRPPDYFWRLCHLWKV